MVMESNFKDVAHAGVDAVGFTLIDMLPAAGYVRNALKVGLDKVTDRVFDPQANKEVPLMEHSEVKTLVDNLSKIFIPSVLAMIDQKVLKPADFPFVEGENELMFEKGLLLQFEALMRQAVTNAVTMK